MSREQDVEIGTIEHQTQPPDGAPWRARLAWWLRKRADAIDGRQSVAVKVCGIPEMTRDDITAAFRFAMRVWAERLAELTRLNVVDREIEDAEDQRTGENRG